LIGQAVAGVLALAAVGGGARATTVYWDGDGLGTAGGGFGLWDTTLLRWATAPSDSVFGTFTNGDTAVFAGTGGTVSLINGLSGSIDVQSNGYLFQGTTSATAPFWTWGGASTVNVATGVTTQLRMSAAGPSLTKTGAGTLVFDAALLTNGGTLNVDAGTLRYGRSNLQSSVGTNGAAAAPNVNTTTRVNVASGAVLDFGNHYHDAVGALNGSGTVILGSQQDSQNLLTSAPSYTYGSTLLINGGNTTNTGTATFESNFSGNIVSDGLTNPKLPMSGGHLVIGTVTTLAAGAGLQATVTLSGNNTFHGPTYVTPGATLFVSGGHALPDDQPLAIGASSIQGPLFELLDDEAVGSIGTVGGSATTFAWVNPNGHTLTIGGDNLHNEFNVGTNTGATIVGGIGAIPGVETERGGLIVKVGTGTQVITTSGQSTYAGKYKISGGTLSFAADRSTGAVPGGLVSDYFVLDGGTLAQSFLLSGASGWNANRGITVTDNGGGLYAQMGSTQTWDITAPIVSTGQGTGGLTKSGPAALRLRGADNSGFTGNWTVTDGILVVGGGFGASGQGLGSKPMGTGSIDLSASLIQFVTDNLTTATTDQAYAVASGAGGKFSYGPGTTLRLDKGTNNSLAVTVGDPAATGGSAFVRKDGGTLLIMANAGAAKLGTATGETLKVNGGVNTVATNTSTGGGTVVPGVLVSTTGTSTEGFFATYDNTAGFMTAAMSPKTDINAADNTDLYAAVAGSTNTLAADANANASVYGVKVGAGTTAADLDLNGQTLSVGGGSASNPATVILGAGSNIKANGGGTIAFGNHEGVLYAESTTASTVAGTITGSQGLTKMGFGAVSLDPTATLSYTGPTRLHQGELIINADNQLPTGTDLVLAGVETSGNFGKAPTLNVNNKTVTVNSLNSVNEKSYNSSTAAATVYLGTSGVLKITGGGSSSFDGLISSTRSNTASTLAAGTTSTVWMAGPGTLSLGLPGKVVSGNFRETLNTYGKLWVSDGGTVVVSMLNAFNNTSTALPTSQTPVLADAIKLDGGTLRFEGLIAGNLGGNTTAMAGTSTINNSRGITLGPAGGTIDVPNAYVNVSLQGTNAVFAGAGTLTKTGDGVLSLGSKDTVTSQNTSAAQWKLVVKGGIVDFTSIASDDGLGPAPAVLDPTNITLDGGGIDGAGTNQVQTIGATRGIYIAAGGGFIGTARGAPMFNGPLSGTGPLKISGSSPVNTQAFNASSDGTFPGATEAYTGTVTLARSTPVYANANNALGIGTITNDPTWPVVFGTQKTTGPVTLGNPFVINKGATFEFTTVNTTSGTPPVTAVSDLILNGQISGDGDIYKGLTYSSGGTLELNNATNNFTGKLVVSQGTLVPLVNGALSTTAAPVQINNTGTLAFKGGVNYASPKPVFVGGSGATIQNLSGDNTFAGPITLTGSAAVASTAGNLTLTGAITGAADSALTKSGAGTVTLAGANTYRGNTTVSAGKLVLASSFTSPGTLNVSDGATAALSAGAGKLLTVAGLNLGTSGTLDLTNNNLAVRYAAGNGTAALTSVLAYIQRAYDHGRWDLTGITSSMAAIPQAGTALAYGDDAANSRVIVKYTWLGDANLDGKVTSADLPVEGGIDWQHGDFNYDGTVNADDYALFSVGAAMQDGTIGGGVPEPTGLAVLAAGALLPLSRRRRRR
jgi:autotransporter-associated beta strand protein